MNTELPSHLQALQNMRANRAAEFRQRDADKRQAAREASNKVVVEQQTQDIENGKWRCCLNCMYWDKDKAGCSKFKATPPPHIVVHGCVEHEDDIPF